MNLGAAYETTLGRLLYFSFGPAVGSRWFARAALSRSRAWAALSLSRAVSLSRTAFRGLVFRGLLFADWFLFVTELL